tara:strand:- start:179 stop:805 length:627 start_codon:yes stop_codon:yes gene_type:complete
MNKFSKVFKDLYYQKMLTPSHHLNPVRNRADNFLQVFKILESSNKSFFNIIETGTTRRDHGHLSFGDDGASTYIFDQFINFYDGELLSVDINQDNVNYSNSLTSDKTKVFCEDSVKFLWNLPKRQNIDLLYLDSFDIEKENPHPSQLHHIKELCSVIDKLKGGTLIIVDDHDAFFTNGEIGKGTYIKEFIKSIGADIIFENYQIGFKL